MIGYDRELKVLVWLMCVNQKDFQRSSKNPLRISNFFREVTFFRRGGAKFLKNIITRQKLRALNSFIHPDGSFSCDPTSLGSTEKHLESISSNQISKHSDV